VKVKKKKEKRKALRKITKGPFSHKIDHAWIYNKEKSPNKRDHRKGKKRFSKAENKRAGKKVLDKSKESAF
jgi:hypothetical protein